MKHPAFTALATCLFLLVSKAALGADERPPFEKLLELNKAALFGGEVKIEGQDKVTIVFNQPGQFEKGFEGTGMVNPTSLKGDANKKILQGPEGSEIQWIAVVGRGNGDWKSRWELVGDIAVDFKLRIPAIQSGSQFNVRVNRDSKNYVLTSFLQSAMLVVAGKTKKRAAASGEYQASPEKWFDRKAPVPVSIRLQGGKFTVTLKGAAGGGAEKAEKKEGKGARKKGAPKAEEKKAEKGAEKKDVELVSLDEAGEISGGRIAFNFSKLSFVMSELVISGKLNREWAEAQLKELEAKGALEKGDKAPPPEAPQPKPKPQLKKEGDDPDTRKKEAEEPL